MSTPRCTNGITIEALAEMPIADIAARIALPAQDWDGKCYGVALALVEANLVPTGSRAVYGHWRGEISPQSSFAGRRTLGFTGHGWVLTPEDRIIDPTRWAFEAVAPYIYIGADPSTELLEVCSVCEHLDSEHADMWGGRCTGGDMADYDCGPCLFTPTSDPRLRQEADEYDEGGNQLRTQLLTPLPAKTEAPAATPAPTGSVAMLLSQHGHDGSPLTGQQALWLANLPLDHYQGFARDCYEWLIENDLVGLIPIDNKRAILG